MREESEDDKSIEVKERYKAGEGYHYYNGGNYRFYDKVTRRIILYLSNRDYIVEKGKVFQISYAPVTGLLVKTLQPTIGVLREGETL